MFLLNFGMNFQTCCAVLKPDFQLTQTELMIVRFQWSEFNEADGKKNPLIKNNDLEKVEIVNLSYQNTILMKNRKNSSID